MGRCFDRDDDQIQDGRQEPQVPCRGEARPHRRTRRDCCNGLALWTRRRTLCQSGTGSVATGCIRRCEDMEVQDGGSEWETGRGKNPDECRFCASIDRNGQGGAINFRSDTSTPRLFGPHSKRASCVLSGRPRTHLIPLRAKRAAQRDETAIPAASGHSGSPASLADTANNGCAHSSDSMGRVPGGSVLISSSS